MNLIHIEQQSPEWYQLKAGKISGTRFGQCISGKQNGLLYELLNERLDGTMYPDDYISDDMQFGLDNEPVACELYEKQSGIKFNRIGAILSDFSPIHMASPDRISEDGSIILEVKCTQDGSKQIERYFKGPETNYLPQIKNYFAVSDEVKQVHWVSYCPNRPERPLVVWIYHRSDFNGDIEKGRTRIQQIESELNEMETQFTF